MSCSSFFCHPTNTEIRHKFYTKKIHNIFIESSVLRKYQSIKENEENVKLTEKIIIINWEMLCCMWEIIENVSGETELKISEFSYYCRYTYVSTHN